jgi:hypothetical protein
LTVWLFGAIIYTYTAKQGAKMGYKVLYAMDTMRDNYGPRKGLEGPFSFSGRVLYYDPKEGQYWDPRTDFYVEQDEMDEINMRFLKVMAAI